MSGIRIKELMTSKLLTVNERETIRRARELMVEHRIRHIPVIDDAYQFVGLMTQRDLLAVTISRLADIRTEERLVIEESITVGEIMNRNVVAVDEDTDLLEAARYLLEHKFGCLPVLHDGHLTGILTESDFVKLVINMLDTADDDD